jgi:hypothetical protein
MIAAPIGSEGLLRCSACLDFRKWTPEAEADAAGAVARALGRRRILVSSVIALAVVVALLLAHLLGLL